MNNNHEANGTFKSLTSGKELKDCILSSDMHGSQMYSQIKYSAQIDVRFGVNFTSSHICFNLGPPWSGCKNAFDIGDSYTQQQWFLSTRVPW